MYAPFQKETFPKFVDVECALLYILSQVGAPMNDNRFWARMRALK